MHAAAAARVAEARDEGGPVQAGHRDQQVAVAECCDIRLVSGSAVAGPEGGGSPLAPRVPIAGAEPSRSRFDASCSRSGSLDVMPGAVVWGCGAAVTVAGRGPAARSGCRSGAMNWAARPHPPRITAAATHGASTSSRARRCRRCRFIAGRRARLSPRARRGHIRFRPSKGHSTAGRQPAVCAAGGYVASATERALRYHIRRPKLVHGLARVLDSSIGGQRLGPRP